jgi:hypothetical protein
VACKRKSNGCGCNDCMGWEVGVPSLLPAPTGKQIGLPAQNPAEIPPAVTGGRMAAQATTAAGMDSPGCNVIPDEWEDECRSWACAKHDACYHVGDCTMWSWFDPPMNLWCQKCNEQVVGDLLRCNAGRGERGLCFPLHTCYTRQCGGDFYCQTGPCGHAEPSGVWPGPSVYDLAHRFRCGVDEQFRWTTCRCEPVRRRRDPRSVFSEMLENERRLRTW